MSGLKYTEEHEWVRLEGDTVTVGVSDFAQSQLGDVVYVELPAVGATISTGGQVAVVESVKAASEVYAPIAGEVTDINSAVADDPSLVNSDPLGAGWFIKVKLTDPAELDRLMDEAGYAGFIEGLG